MRETDSERETTACGLQEILVENTLNYLADIQIMYRPPETPVRLRDLCASLQCFIQFRLNVAPICCLKVIIHLLITIPFLSLVKNTTNCCVKM